MNYEPISNIPKVLNNPIIYYSCDLCNGNLSLCVKWVPWQIMCRFLVRGQCGRGSVVRRTPPSARPQSLRCPKKIGNRSSAYTPVKPEPPRSGPSAFTFVYARVELAATLPFSSVPYSTGSVLRRRPPLSTAGTRPGTWSPATAARPAATGSPARPTPG